MRPGEDDSDRIAHDVVIMKHAFREVPQAFALHNYAELTTVAELRAIIEMRATHLLRMTEYAVVLSFANAET